MALRPGDIAPDFSLPSIDGSTVTLSQLRGRPVWLGFYRYAACPLCNLRIHELVKRYGHLPGDALAVLGVFQSPVGKMHDYLDKHAAPFPLLSDPQERVYELYGLTTSALGFVKPSVLPKLATAAAQGYASLYLDPDGSMARLPGDYLIGRDGRVVDVFMASDISEHIPFERVDAFLRRAG